jgi:hypothetical protein
MELSEFTCPKCREVFHAPSTLAGESATCPRCLAEVECWPDPTNQVSRPRSPTKPASNAPRPEKPAPLPARPKPLSPMPTPLTHPPSPMAASHNSPRVRWGIAIGLILVVVIPFIIGRYIAARLGEQTEEKSPVSKDDSSGTHASDRAMVEHLIITAFPAPRGIDGSYWFTFWVSTTDPTRNANFVAWSGNVKDLPPMTDDLGNRYKAFLPLADPNDPSTQLLATDQIERVRKIHSLELHLSNFLKTLPASLSNGSGSITSQAARGDLIGYPPIVPAAKKLYLSLPAKNVGDPGEIHFEFHVEKLEKLFAQKP